MPAPLDRSIISDPVATSLPDSFPFFSAVCAASLMDEDHSVLIATGCAGSQERANAIAEFEAIERFSIAYDPSRPDTCSPFLSSDGMLAPLPQAEITLRAPGRRNSSKGSAAAPTRDAAAHAALLEHLEHVQLKRFYDRAVALPALPPSRSVEAQRYADWCDGNLRKLEFRGEIFAPGYAVVLCRCTDLDGGRPTYGSSAKTSLASAMISAAHEAMFSWRNMIEVERNGIGEASDPEGNKMLRIYRGAEPGPAWPDTDKQPSEDGNHTPATTAQLVTHLAELSASRVQVFDMTRDEFDVPVARVHLTKR